MIRTIPKPQISNPQAMIRIPIPGSDSVMQLYRSFWVEEEIYSVLVNSGASIDLSRHQWCVDTFNTWFWRARNAVVSNVCCKVYVFARYEDAFEFNMRWS